MRNPVFLIAALALIAITGCSVSEEDYQKQVKARDELRQEVSSAQNENAVLNDAILAIYQERERLKEEVRSCRDRLQGLGPGSADANIATAPPPPTPLPEPEPEITPPPEADTAIATTAATVTPTQAASTGSDRPVYYYVNPGDRLTDISRRTGVDMETLKRLNGINDSTALSKGRRIRLR